MIHRKLKQELVDASSTMPIVSLTGPRQSGKTTLTRDTFPDYKYFNLENPDYRLLALNDPRSFLKEAGYQGVIIDEAQLAPDLFSYIQVIVDENKSAKYILTGSQNFLLSKRITQSLAGRVRILNLLPLSMAELQTQGYIHQSHISYIFQGGYPRLYSTPISPQKWLPDYIQSYLERDVRDFIKIRELTQFQTFLKLCASRIGQIFNYAELSNAVGVSDYTIRQWLSVLEASYIVYRLDPYFKNLGKRLIKSPKIYFYDTGLACYLLGLEKEKVSSYYQYGSLFENFIINEIMKSYTNRGERPSLYFWRESNGTEIDLLIPKGDTLIPIEIKSSQTLRMDFFKNIKKIRNLPKASDMIEGYAIYGGDLSVTNTISWRDLQKFLLEKL